MGVTKIYDIVTNDEYELPVKLHVVGTQAVGEFIGTSANNIAKRMSRGSWPGKYKAIETGVKRPLTENQKRIRNKKKCKEYYYKNHERLLEYQRERYRMRKAVQNGSTLFV